MYFWYADLENSLEYLIVQVKPCLVPPAIRQLQSFDIKNVRLWDSLPADTKSRLLFYVLCLLLFKIILCTGIKKLSRWCHLQAPAPAQFQCCAREHWSWIRSLLFSVYLSVCPSTLSIYLFTCLSSICLSVHSIYLHVCLSVYLPIQSIDPLIVCLFRERICIYFQFWLINKDLFILLFILFF